MQGINIFIGKNFLKQSVANILEEMLWWIKILTHFHCKNVLQVNFRETVVSKSFVILDYIARDEQCQFFYDRICNYGHRSIYYAFINLWKSVSQFLVEL